MKKKDFTQWAAAFFIVLFGYAALYTVAGHNKFYQQLAQLPLPVHWAVWVCRCLPGVEIIIAGMLCCKRWRLAGLFASFSLMLLFTWYLMIIITLSKYMPCCGAVIFLAMNRNQHLLFNSCAVVIAAMAILFYLPKIPRWLVLDTTYQSSIT